MNAIRVILACIRKADKEFNLINPKDRICLGISGGKDSMAMFYALHLYKKFSKMDFEIIPCTIDLGFKDFNTEKTRSFAKKLGYDLHVEDGKTVYEILKAQQEIQHTPMLPCSICSKMKKAIINKVAHDFKCNKVAFAHHRDDAIETLLMNSIYGGRLATFNPKMFLSGEKITFIRPLVLAKEPDIARLCKEEKLPISGSGCPNDKNTQRESMKKILSSIYKKYPSSRENFLTMLLNETKEDLFYNHQEFKLDEENIFFKKVINAKDAFDYLKYTKKTKILDNDYLTTKYLLINENKTIASIAIKEEKSKSFNILEYKYSNKTLFIKFIKQIMINIYELSNPCTISIKSTKRDTELFEKIGFKKSKTNDLDFKIILKDLKTIKN